LSLKKITRYNLKKKELSNKLLQQERKKCGKGFEMNCETLISK